MNTRLPRWDAPAADLYLKFSYTSPPDLGEALMRVMFIHTINYMGNHFRDVDILWGFFPYTLVSPPF
jgi:hypothetical protein